MAALEKMKVMKATTITTRSHFMGKLCKISLPNSMNVLNSVSDLATQFFLVKFNLNTHS